MIGDSRGGLLLVGHGSRDAAGIEEVFATAQLVAVAAGGSPVEPCFLEFARPNIAEGFERLTGRGVDRITVVPLLLFRAGHAERDIPRAIMAAAAGFPGVVVDWADHLGCHEGIVQLSKQRYDEAVSAEIEVPAEQTALMMVGRGSHSAAATVEMGRFLELRRRLTPVAYAQACFLSMAEPGLESALEQAAASGARRIIVQPHLLFAGVLVDRVAQTVALFSERFEDLHWLTSGHLGPSARLAESILDRARAAQEK
jgi:sirohydrochlorin ferrochelatase